MALANNPKPPATGPSPLVRAIGLVKHFPVTRGLFSRRVAVLRAVDGVSFEIHGGETLGLVGESGCGKSTTGRLLIRLLEPTSGKVFFEDRDVFRLDKTALRSVRRSVQIVFQDPFASLNPRMTAGDIVGEPLEVHRAARGREKQRRAAELLEVVGLGAHHLGRYPHEFSAGQRQRIGVARALALNPRFVICDEPVSSLDVSVQAQILNLLMDLQEKFRLTYLFIAHDLSVVKHISNRIAVMYLGKIVEVGPKARLYSDPAHPYTQALLSSVPIPDPTRPRKRVLLSGEVPSPLAPPQGCRFHPRCPRAVRMCLEQEPAFRELGAGRFVACHLA